MASLSDIAADLKSAMLARESEKVSVLRMLQSELKNNHIKKGGDLTEDEILQVIRKEIKKRQETADLYTTQNQPERAAQETQEASILSVYLPPAADPSAVEAFIAGRLQELGTPTPHMRGQLMKETMAHFGASVDGKTVNEIVSRLLN
jgi:uncharacterized protein YqeY